MQLLVRAWCPYPSTISLARSNAENKHPMWSRSIASSSTTPRPITYRSMTGRPRSRVDPASSTSTNRYHLSSPSPVRPIHPDGPYLATLSVPKYFISKNSCFSYRHAFRTTLKKKMEGVTSRSPEAKPTQLSIVVALLSSSSLLLLLVLSVVNQYVLRTYTQLQGQQEQDCCSTCCPFIISPPRAQGCTYALRTRSFLIKQPSRFLNCTS